MPSATTCPSSRRLWAAALTTLKLIPESVVNNIFMNTTGFLNFYIVALSAIEYTGN